MEELDLRCIGCKGKLLKTSRENEYICERCDTIHIIEPSDVMPGFSVVNRYDGKFYLKGDKQALKMERIEMPVGEKGDLVDQDDIVIWLKFNILLQAIDELTQEFGHAGDATRQLRIVVAELIRRDMFGYSVKEREPTDELLWTWYEVLKQFVEGANKGNWDHVDGDDRQYVEVVKELKSRGCSMPSQRLDVEPILFSGRAIT